MGKMKKASISWNIRQIVKMIDKGSISFDLSYQRNRVWDLQRESLLIDSILREYPIPPIFTTKTEGENGNIYEVLDGKQRFSTLARFLHGEFALEGLEDYEHEGEILNLNGCDYNSLPEDLQDVINSYSLTVYYLDDATEEEINDVFVRLNNGMPLTKFELTRAKAGNNMPIIKGVTEHPVFSEFAISDKAKLRYTDQEIALQMLITCLEEEPNFTGNYMQQWAEETVLTDINLKYMNEILDVFQYIFENGDPKAVRKAFKKVHLSGLTYIINKYKNQVAMYQFKDFVNGFFANKSVPSESYSRNSKAGSAKPDAIKKRFEAMDLIFYEGLHSVNVENEII